MPHRVSMFDFSCLIPTECLSRSVMATKRGGKEGVRKAEMGTAWPADLSTKRSRWWPHGASDRVFTSSRRRQSPCCRHLLVLVFQLALYESFRGRAAAVFAQSAAAMRLARKVNGCSSSNCSEKSGGQVPAFTIRSWSLSNHQQSGIRVEEPPRINVFAERPTPSMGFRRIYDRGDLPVCIVHESRLYRLGWKVLYSNNIMKLVKLFIAKSTSLQT